MFKISYLKNLYKINSLRSINTSQYIYNFPKMNTLSKESVMKMKEKLSSDESFNAKYFEEMLNMFPRSSSGSVTMNKELFNKGLKEAKTEADIEFLLSVIADFMGNYCALSGNNLDDYLKKSIELNCPNKVIPLLSNHRQFLYYPDPNLILSIVKLHLNNKDWPSLKTFYNAIGRKYYIKKLNPLYDIYIETAFANKDYDECVNCFLDILDYNENKLSPETFNRIIYANKNLVRDSVFVELFEKALNCSKVDSYGVYFALMIYNYKINNEDRLNHYLQKLEHFSSKPQTCVQVYESDFVKVFLDEVSTKPDEKIHSRVKEILLKSSRSLFSDAYNEKITKIIE